MPLFYPPPLTELNELMFPAQHDLSGLLASSIQTASNSLKEKL